MISTDFLNHKENFIIHLEVERRLSENTFKSYQSDLNKLYAFWAKIIDENKKNIEIKHAIERYLVSLHYKKASRSTIARKISCFKSFEKYLLSSGIVLNLDIKRPRLHQKLPIHLSIDELTYLIDQLNKADLNTNYPIRTKIIIELLYATGIRCTELVNIRLCDIDMINKTIRIKGKGDKERLALFGSKAKECINDYLLNERPPVTNSQENLLVNYRGTGITSRSIQRIFATLQKILPAKKPLTPHKIRHSFATHLLCQGVDLRVVQELLGHKTITSTERYTHISLDNLATTCESRHPIKKLLKTNTDTN